MTMSKLDLHVACSTPFVDRTTSLWFTKELVSNTSNIDEFKRRWPNCHAAPDATIEHRKPRTTENRVITKDRSNSCPIPIKTYDERLSLIAGFSNLLPSTTDAARNPERAFGSSLDFAISMFNSHPSLVLEDVHPAPGCSTDGCDTAIDQFSSWNEAGKQEYDQMMLSIGKPYENASHLRPQLQANGLNNHERFAAVQAIEELVTDVMVHLDYVASLSIPLITWDCCGEISVTCSSRLSRVLQLLESMEESASLLSSMSEHDNQESDLSSILNLLSSLGLISQWIYQQCVRLQTHFNNENAKARVRLVSAIGITLTRVIFLTKSDYSLLRSTLCKMRRQIWSSRQLYHVLRCSHYCYNDDMLICCEETKDITMDDTWSDASIPSCSHAEGEDLIQYIQGMREVKEETITSIEAYKVLVQNVEQETSIWIQECSKYDDEIQDVWIDDWQIKLGGSILKMAGHLERRLGDIKAAINSVQCQLVQAKGENPNTDLLCRLRESKLKIMDMEPCMERITKRVYLLEKYRNWGEHYDSVMQRMAEANQHMDLMLDERDVWAAKIEKCISEDQCPTLSQQCSTIESSMLNAELEKATSAFEEFEETAASSVYRLPNRMYERQKSFISDIIRLKGRLQFVKNISQQQCQVSEIHRHANEVKGAIKELQRIPIQNLSIQVLEELCKKTIDIMVSSHTSVQYPESPENDQACRNSRSNHRVRSGIGTLQSSLMSELDDLKRLIKLCHQQREVQKTMEHVKLVAERHMKLLQSRIDSLEQSQLNMKARVTLQDLNELTRNTIAQHGLFTPVILGTKAQITLLQSSEEGGAMYTTQMRAIAKNLERLKSVEQRRLAALDVIRVRTVWELRYKSFITSLNAIIERLPTIMKIIWRFDNKDMDFESVYLDDLDYNSLLDRKLQEQLAYEQFIKHYGDSNLYSTGDADFAMIFADAGHRHSHLEKMGDLVLIVIAIQRDRLQQRRSVQELTRTHDQLLKQLWALFDRLQHNLLENCNHTSFSSEIEELQLKLRDFDHQCLGRTLYPDCLQHTMLPHGYIQDLERCNEDIRQHSNQLQDSLCQKMGQVLESYAIHCDVLSLLEEKNSFQKRYDSCRDKILAIDSDYVMSEDPVPQHLNSTLVLVQGVAIQPEVNTLSNMANLLVTKFSSLVSRLSKLDCTTNSWEALNARSKDIGKMAKSLLLVFQAMTGATLALHLKQNWETWWKTAKTNLEQCVSMIEGNTMQEKLLMDPATRSSLVDSAEQKFRITIQTDVATSNFGFRNLSKAYTCIREGNAVLPKLQQKHGELRRLASKIEWLLARARGHGEHMNSRARKLSSPNSLEVRARKISLPTRKSSSFNDHLTASRSAIISSKSTGTRSRSSLSSRSGHKAKQMYIPDPANVLDVEVGRIINESPYQICVKAVPGEVGRYWFGDVQPKLAYCRILKSSMVMVRVGGGWTELTQFLRDHALLEGNFIPRERSLTEDEGLREGFIQTHRANAPLGRNSKNRSEQHGIKDGDRFIVGNGIEVKMTRAQDERTVPRSSRPNHLQN